MNTACQSIAISVSQSELVSASVIQLFAMVDLTQVGTNWLYSWFIPSNHHIIIRWHVIAILPMSWCTKVTLNMPSVADDSEIVSSVHTVIVVVLQSPATVCPNATVTICSFYPLVATKY